MPRRRYENRLSAWNDDPFDDFNRMRQQMFSGFGNFRDDDFFGGFEQRISRNFGNFGFGDMDMFGDMEDMQMMSRHGGGGGNYTMQTMSTKTVIGPDGRARTEKTVNNETSTIGRDGRRIKTKNKVYKDTGKGIKKVERERQLGDRRIKVVREINGDERNEYRDMENMDEDELDRFNDDFNRQARDSGLSRFQQVGYRRKPSKKKYKALYYK